MVILKATETNIVDLINGQEGSERVAAGHAPAVLAADVLIVRAGGVLALVPTDEERCMRPGQK